MILGLHRHRAFLVRAAEDRGLFAVAGNDPHPLVELADDGFGAAVSRNATWCLRQAAGGPPDGQAALDELVEHCSANRPANLAAPPPLNFTFLGGRRTTQSEPYGRRSAAMPRTRALP
jgi:hypothetical protein